MQARPRSEDQLTTGSTAIDPNDPELSVERIAARLGLPAGMLIRRIEAGDVPARRDVGPDGVLSYHLRLSDLGISGEDAAAFPEPEAEATLSTATAAATRESTASNGGAPEATGHNGLGPSASNDTPEADATTTAPPEPSAESASPAPELAVQGRPVARPDISDARDADLPSFAELAVVVPEPGDDLADDIELTGRAADGAIADSRDPLDRIELPSFDSVENAVPPPDVVRSTEVALLSPSGDGPRSELAHMSIDPRELVAGLLDRWERTLEQRIYAEQRQRFESELQRRQAELRQLQAELQTARAENALVQAEKDRALAEKERELADHERLLFDARRAPKRRGWFSFF